MRTFMFVLFGFAVSAIVAITSLHEAALVFVSYLLGGLVLYVINTAEKK